MGINLYDCAQMLITPEAQGPGPGGRDPAEVAAARGI